MFRDFLDLPGWLPYIILILYSCSKRGIMKRTRFPVMFAVFTLLALHCSSTKPLTDIEKAKLDKHLVRLLSGEQGDETLFDVQEKADGTKLYAVIIHSNQAEEIKRLGVSISSVFGSVIVVRATVKELRKIVSLPSVRAIETGSKNFIQPNQ
jgi:hypothetical protein